MIWHRLKLIIIVGTALLLVITVAGTAILLERAERATLTVAETALERSALAVENALNRQLLQVNGALASLPTLFAAAGASPHDREAAGQLLRGLSFQTLAFRDLLLITEDSAILTSARPRTAQRRLPVEASDVAGEPTALLGPVRNRITGDWALYIARAAPGWDGIIPIAEVPVATLMGLLAETGIAPGVRIFLERPNGQLIAALPHDEVQTGQIRDSALGRRTPDGKAFSTRTDSVTEIAVVRASLYQDVRVILAVDRHTLLADFRRGRDRAVVAAALGGMFVTAFAAALIFALRQRELAEAERARSAAVLANAVEAMSDGFAMWDENDRLVTCNQRYRDLSGASAPFITPGVRFEEVLRRGVEAGEFPEEASDVEGFVTAFVAWHMKGRGDRERRLPDGRWLLMKDRHTADGGIVSNRTDITALKTMVADLAQANARAKEAIEEAQRQNEALMEQESRIRYLAHHDELTGLPNRVLFRGRIEAALCMAQDQGMRTALLYLDLDRFKDVNDTLGHPAGDALLRAVAARLGACVQDPASIARLSGDEFAVISMAPAQPDEAGRLSARIIEELSRPYTILGLTIAVSVSIGIAVADDQDTDPDALLKQADLALYQAKAAGRGTVCVFEPEMDAHLHARLQMEADLRHAMTGHQFELVYQPIYTLASGDLCGFEALLRWRHPRRGLVNPAAFIPLAEETRLIAEIGAWVVRRALIDARTLPSHLKVAINLSPVQLAFGNIVSTVDDALRENAIAPGRLELEITETALFTNDPRNLDALRRLRSLGVRIVLDDFGTGYSSLSHLLRFPLDKIKIDRSFVQDMTEQSDSAAIVEAVAALACRLGMTTTAEGIETAEQLTVARKAGCTEVQGHFLGAPRPFLNAADTIESALLRSF
ncbi:EAL domain-containing protein [Xanthobacter sp. AM11]|uniref:bifunctional diguanylate cyclase/phosphodiesterase n=1 Tax=Xanthobacter sp. AM11 TaxID=3380643 RepID=UPI0039BF7736